MTPPDDNPFEDVIEGAVVATEPVATGRLLTERNCVRGTTADSEGVIDE